MCSFGKDSIAMLYTMKKYNIPIDKIVYCSIFFDNDISAELPEHDKWIWEYAMPKIEDEFGVKVTIIQSKYSYKDLFYAPITRGDRQGQNRGFPLLFGSWCHRDLKIKPVKDYLKRFGDYTQYLGIASDEPKRVDFEIKQGNKLPLVEYGITEQMAIDICKKYNLLSPAYSYYSRLGCWFCHKQSNKALEKVVKMHPELYCKLCELDKDSHIKFKQTKTATEFKNNIKQNT